MSDVTAVLPIKGKSDLHRFNKILKPSFLDVYDLNLILITDEKIDESDRIKVINDDLVFRSVNDARNSRGWFKQQVIKLKSWKYVDTEWMLILDADCFFLFQGSINNLFKSAMTEFREMIEEDSITQLQERLNALAERRLELETKLSRRGRKQQADKNELKEIIAKENAIKKISKFSDSHEKTA